MDTETWVNTINSVLHIQCYFMKTGHIYIRNTYNDKMHKFNFLFVLSAGDPVDAVDFTVHACNSIYILIDFFITAMPIRLLHFWYSILYGLLYVVFSLIYLGAGGTDKAGNNYIYSILDFFGNPGAAFALAGLSVFVFAPLLWLLIYGIYNLRTFLNRKCCSCGRQEYLIFQNPSDEA